jgi:hypothetical protein
MRLGISIFCGMLVQVIRGRRTMKQRGCRTCFVDMQRIVLADGSAMLFCAVCDTIGDERHVAAGARCAPAGMGRKPLKLVVDRPKSAIVKKIPYQGKNP